MSDRIVGREAELAAAERFLDDAVERGAVLELVGEPGIGKTTVWRTVVEAARSRGFLVLQCRPAEAEAKLALTAVADLLEPVQPERFEVLPDPQRRALDAALLRTAIGDLPIEPRALGAAIRTLLADLGLDRPLLVAIDDGQWLDITSATVLGFAMRRLTDSPVAWLVSSRPTHQPQLGFDRLDPNRRDRIDLGPLSLAAIHHVIESHVGEPLTRSLLVRAHQASGGNPFYAIEIARELIHAGVSGGTMTPVPRDLRDLLTKRLHRLPANSRDALLIASAMSTPTTATLDEQALAPAEAAGIIRIDETGRVAFVHPLFATAVYGTASRTDRTRVHALLADKADDAEERARHLAAATVAPDAAVADAIEAGAEQARARGAWVSAAQLLERARDLTPEREVLHRRAIRAAEYYAHAGERAHARSILEHTLMESLSSAVRVNALRVLGEVAHSAEQHAEARRSLEEAAEFAENSLQEAKIRLRLGAFAAYDLDADRARSQGHRALELAERAGDGPTIAQALALCAMFDWMAGQDADWAKVNRALELDDASHVGPIYTRPTNVNAFLHAFVGRHEEARRLLTSVWSNAVDEGDESDLAFVLLWFSWLETRAGRMDAAISLAEEASATARLTESTMTAAWARLQRTYIRSVQGEIEQTRAECAASMGVVARGGPIVLLWLVASLAVLEVSLGDAEAALAVCEPLLQAIEANGIQEPVPMFFLPDALEALVMAGNVDRADTLLRVFENRARELDRMWALATGARCRAVVLAARGQLESALASIEVALKEHERIELPFDRARALLVKGVVERRLRRRGKARESLEEASAEFERLGASLWAARAREELAHLGLKRGSSLALTEAERRIAELTAAGKTRREVAAVLFISPKTVDATLVRVYRKLGVGSRAELGARMSEMGQR